MAGISCAVALCDTGFCLFHSGHRVKRFHAFGLFDAASLSLWFAWRCLNRGHIDLAHSEAPGKPSGFFDHISMTFCPCTVIGFPRVSGAANFRIEFSSGSQTLEEFFHSRGSDHSLSLRRTGEIRRTPSSSRWPKPSAPTCSPTPPWPAPVVSC